MAWQVKFTDGSIVSDRTVPNWDIVPFKEIASVDFFLPNRVLTFRDFDAIVVARLAMAGNGFQRDLGYRITERKGGQHIITSVRGVDVDVQVFETNFYQTPEVCFRIGKRA